MTKGALVVKEDLAKVELYGCMAALRDVRAKCVKMNECIMKVGYPGNRNFWATFGVGVSFVHAFLVFYLHRSNGTDVWPFSSMMQTLREHRVHLP